MNLRHAARWGAALFLAAGIGAAILAGGAFLRAPSDQGPSGSCAAALRGRGWSVSVLPGGRIEARRSFDFSDWRDALYSTDAALGAHACHEFAAQSACIGPACGGSSSIVFARRPAM